MASSCVRDTKNNYYSKNSEIRSNDVNDLEIPGVSATPIRKSLLPYSLNIPNPSSIFLSSASVSLPSMLNQQTMFIPTIYTNSTVMSLNAEQPNNILVSAPSMGHWDFSSKSLQKIQATDASQIFFKNIGVPVICKDLKSKALSDGNIKNNGILKPIIDYHNISKTKNVNTSNSIASSSRPTFNKESLRYITVSKSEISFTHSFPILNTEKKNDVNFNNPSREQKIKKTVDLKPKPFIVKFASSSIKKQSLEHVPIPDIGLQNCDISSGNDMISIIISKDTTQSGNELISQVLNGQKLEEDKFVKDSLLAEESCPLALPYSSTADNCWTCLQCSERINGIIPFAMHSKSHVLEHLRMRFTCQICKLCFKSQDSFKIHSMTHARGARESIVANNCHGVSHSLKPGSEKVQKIQKGMKSKTTWKGNFNCQICQKRFSSGKYLLRHLSKHSGEFVCSLCNKEFTRKENIKKHLCIQKMQSEGFHCASCKKTFKKFHLLKLHSLEHDEQLSCRLCTQTFSNEEALKIHLVECSRNPIVKDKPGEKSKLSCHFCRRKFSSLFFLNNHVSVCRQLALLNEKGEVNCDHCGTLCVSSSELRAHLQTHTHAYQCLSCMQRFRSRGTYEMHVCGTEFSCDVCDCVLRSFHELFKHITIHGPPPLCCSSCRYPYYKKESLKSHICKMASSKSDAEKDVKRKKILCPFCPSIFVADHNLKKHMASLHDIPIKQKFVCEKCGKRFHRSDLLKSHEKVHMAPSFECLLCHKKFKSHRTFTSHSRLHVKDYRFNCNSCDKGFAQKKDFISHVRAHHSSPSVITTVSDSFKCQHCQVQFSCSEQLETHFVFHQSKEIQEQIKL